MGLWGTFSNWVAGNDAEAQEAELKDMQEKLETAKKLEATGVTPEKAAAMSGFGTGQSLGGGNAGTKTGTGLLQAGANMLANWGALIGDTVGLKGVGTPDPGSIAAETGAGIGMFRKFVFWALVAGTVGGVLYFYNKGK